MQKQYRVRDVGVPLSRQSGWKNVFCVCTFYPEHWVLATLPLSFGQFLDPQAGGVQLVTRSTHSPNLGPPCLFPCNMRLGHFRKHVLRRRSNGWLYGQTVNHTLPTPTSSACITERLKRGWPRTQIKNAFCVCSFCPEHLSANYSACECLKF